MSETFLFLVKNSDNLKSIIETLDEYGKVSEQTLYVLPIVSEEGVRPGYVAALKAQVSASRAQQTKSDEALKKGSIGFEILAKGNQDLLGLVKELSVDYKVFAEEVGDEGRAELLEEFASKIGSKDLESSYQLWAKVITVLFRLNSVASVLRFSIIHLLTLLANSDEKIYYRVLREVEVAGDETLIYSGDNLLFQQKMFLWMVKYSKTQSKEQAWFELGVLHGALFENFELVSDDPRVFEAFVRFRLLGKTREKLDVGLGVSLKWIEAGFELISALCGVNLSQVLLLDEGVLDQPVFAPEEIDRRRTRALRWIGVENFEAFLREFDESVEKLLKEMDDQSMLNSSQLLRMTFLNSLLTFNEGYRNQKKIINNLKLLQEFARKGSYLPEQVFSLEVQHLSQLRNFKKLANLANKIEFIGGIKSEKLLTSFKTKLLESSLIALDKIDPDLLIIENFEVLQYTFSRAEELELTVRLKMVTQIEKFELVGAQVSLKTNNPSAPRVLSSPVDLTLSRGVNDREFRLLFPPHSFSGTNFLLFERFDFRLNDVKYQIENFEGIRNKNANLSNISFICINKFGFLHRFAEKQIFFEHNNSNYFFVEVAFFDNSESLMRNISIEVQKNSKYVLIDESVAFVSTEGLTELKLTGQTLSLPPIKSGKYVFLFKIFILHKHMKHYSIKLNSTYKNQSSTNFVSLKNRDETFCFLSTDLNFVDSDKAQLKLRNSLIDDSVSIHRIGGETLQPPKTLRPEEEVSKIVDSAPNIVLHYSFANKRFLPLEVDAFLQPHCAHILKRSSQVETALFQVESLLYNKNLFIRSFELKNKADVKLFEKNMFLLRFLYSREPDESLKGKVYLELKWPKDEYCIIGKNRFELKSKSEEKLKEIEFLALESGFLSFPQLMLVEIKPDGSEHQHLLSDEFSNKRFYVQENVMKITKFG